MSNEFDSRAFRNACGQFLTGVTIVTTKGEDGQPVGVTANSFSSVSLDPPLILVCLDKRLVSLPSFLNSKGHAVHVLALEQEEISSRFATRGADKFSGLSHESGLYDAPILPNALVAFECRTHSIVEAGDHVILIGEVERYQTQETERPPLGYLRGKYTTSVEVKGNV